MSILSRLFHRRSPEEQLVVDVVEELKRRGIVGAAYDHERYALKVGPRILGLRNLFLDWRLRDRREKAALVKRYVNGQFNDPRDLPAFDVAAQSLLPIVRSRAAISQASLVNQLYGAEDADGAESAWATLVADLATGVALDRRDSICELSRESLRTLGVTWEEAFGRALENLRQLDTRMIFMALGQGLPDGVYHCDSVEDYQSSMLLIPGRFPQLPDGAGEVIAMVPGRNSMWITGSRDEAGIAALLDIGERSLEAVAHRCSATLLRLDGETWTVYVPETDHLKRRQRVVTMEQEATNYGYQKALLDELHDKRDEGGFVASYGLNVEGESAKSWATWSSGVSRTLLPRVEFLGLVEQIVDPASGLTTGIKRMIEVAWDRAMPVVGDLMEEVPGLYPPRYSVRRFPDESALAELERRGRRHEPPDDTPAAP